MKISIFFLLVVAIMLLASLQDCDGYPKGRIRKRTAQPSTDGDSTGTATNAANARPRRPRAIAAKQAELMAMEDTPPQQPAVKFVPWWKAISDSISNSDPQPTQVPKKNSAKKRGCFCTD